MTRAEGTGGPFAVDTEGSRSPGQFVFRTREFEQMEMEFFCEPEEGDKWLEYWKNERLNWYLKLGCKAESTIFGKIDRAQCLILAKKIN